ncbi:MAG: RNA-guided endonuclease TnpB family protein, partial [Cyanobacteria bacterium J06639_18]
KSQNRRLVNEILRHGNQVKTEKVSIKGWQKRYGKAISAKSPGFFQSELKRKAVRGASRASKNANGSFLGFSTQKTALSQTHLDGNRIKKTLSMRIHRDVTGFEIQRDLFSAFLSRHVCDDKLSLLDAQSEYPRAEPLLMDAWKQYQQTANRVAECKSRKCYNSSERLSIQVSNSDQIASKGDKSEGHA